MDTIDTVDTIIIDLFHFAPEKIGPESAEHDIVGTSESGINFVLGYGKKHRFYYCDDIDHEESIHQWHFRDLSAIKHEIKLIDVQSIVEPLNDLASENKAVRLILNGQGALQQNGFEEDAIAGYNIHEILGLIDNFIIKFNLNTEAKKLSELIIFSCCMAQSDEFISALLEKFSQTKYPIKIILFSEMVFFSKQGHFISFFKNSSSVEQTLENLTNKTATILRFMPAFKIKAPETTVPLTFFPQFEHNRGQKRKFDDASKENQDPEDNIKKNKLIKKTSIEDPT